MVKKAGYYSVLSHLWIQWIILGGILLNTFMVYPNIFHNVPPDSRRVYVDNKESSLPQKSSIYWFS